MGFVMEYRLEYDDPYLLLAQRIVSDYRPADVLRMLTDNEYILACIVKEVRQQDLSGMFVDCIIEDILAHKKRMEMMGHLDELARYFYESLDKKRLKQALIKSLSEIGIVIG